MIDEARAADRAAVWHRGAVADRARARIVAGRWISGSAAYRDALGWLRAVGSTACAIFSLLSYRVAISSRALCRLWFPAAAGRVVFLSLRLVILSFFSSRGWESWDVGYRPLIPERMPVLVDDDLLFEDGPGAPRPAVAVNQWLRELPASGAAVAGHVGGVRAGGQGVDRVPGTHGVGLFDSRERLKAGLSRYAEHRAAGPARQRFSATTWGRHMSILSLFYRWAMDEGHAQAEPFTYRTARALFAGTGREVRVNLAVRRTPKPHVTIRYLEPDFTAIVPATACAGWRRTGPPMPGTTAGSWPATPRSRAGAGHRAAPAGVHLPAALGDPGAPRPADDDADPVPGPGGGDQGPQVPHHVGLL